MNNLPADKIISCFYGSSNDCVKVVNTEGYLMSFNPNGLKVMEIDNEKDVIGKEWLNFWNNGMKSVATAALDKAKAGKLAKFEGYCPTFKGTMKYWQVTIAPLYGEFGDVQWLLVMSHDATDYKNLQIKVSEQQTIIDGLRDQIAVAT